MIRAKSLHKYKHLYSETNWGWLTGKKLSSQTGCHQANRENIAKYDAATIKICQALVAIIDLFSGPVGSNLRDSEQQWMPPRIKVDDRMWMSDQFRLGHVVEVLVDLA